MLGTIVNVMAVLIGGSIGLLLKRAMPKRLEKALMTALGLCTIYIGISGLSEGNNTLILILSMVIGTFIGELSDLDLRINRLGSFIQEKFRGVGGKDVSIAEGFVSASLLFCVGAMTIVGSLQSGLTGNHETLFAKSMLDFVAAILFSSSLGIGVLFSAAFVLVYQGGITLLAQWAAPLLSDAAVAEMSCVGALILIALGLNMMGLSKFKVMNFVPAIFIPIILCLFM